MKYAEILALRDLTIRDFLLAKLPISDEEKEALGHSFDSAVKAADEDLKAQLRDLFGKEADHILKRKQAAEESTL